MDWVFPLSMIFMMFFIVCVRVTFFSNNRLYSSGSQALANNDFSGALAFEDKFLKILVFLLGICLTIY
jgi:lipoprotein NlpI